MLFNSVDYLIFFPLVVLVYWLFPCKYRYIWVVATSYYFYMCWDAGYGFILLYITGVSYIAGNMFSRVKRKGAVIAVSGVLSFSVLFFLKYYNFAISNMNRIFSAVHIGIEIPMVNLLLPVGISFYIFQAFGYIVDVYRGKVEPERKFLKYAAFISFFPSLLSGPIERADNLLEQIRQGTSLELNKVKRGLLMISWGLFLKLVLSNNISPMVDEIFDNYSAYGGIEAIIATALFGLQIYCDFAGYSYLAIGSACIMGFHLKDNFKAPYLSVNTAEFWRKWHISLTSWFRDYLYIPLGGNRKGRGRKHLNTMLVFAISGLWHGASWGFIFWGMLNGAYLVVGEVTCDLRRRIQEKLKVQNDSRLYRVFACITTFVLIDYAWMYFRADSFRQGLEMTRSIFRDIRLNYLLSGEIFRELGVSACFFVFLILLLCLLFIVDYMQYKNVDVISRILGLRTFWRWGIYLGLLFIIIVFGIYGYSYEQTQFIYFQF